MKIKDIEKEIINKEAQLLDVREKKEWNDGHLLLANSLPLSSLQEGEEPPAEMDRDKKTYLHCRSGNRVNIAAPLLESMGFSRVIPLSEGFAELVAQGLAAKGPLKAYLNQIEDFQFEFKSAAGYTAILDGPQNIGGQGEGLRPMELVVAGLGGCSSFDILNILRKSKQPVEDFKVEIKAHRREEIPKVFTHIHLIYQIKGQVEASQLEKAIDLSLGKYCSVAKMLEPQVKITSEYHIEN